MKELLAIAKRAAAAGAAVHLAAMSARQDLAIGIKHSASDLVTEVDRETERVVVASIHAARPEDAIIGEEGANLGGSSGIRWILDPLDGTTNFVHRYPAHSVAIGVEIDGRRAIGIVHDTSRNRVYAGVIGDGATLDDVPISVSSEADLSRALVGTGFLPDPDVRRAQADLLREILPRVRDVRRSGCPSLDICAVASGVLDGFYECGLGPWDIAAAGAIAEAAGATVLTLPAGILPAPLLVVANSRLAGTLGELISKSGVIGRVRWDGLVKR